jgi:hypothetical protein
MKIGIFVLLTIFALSSCERQGQPKPESTIQQGETKSGQRPDGSIDPSGSVLVAEARELLDEAKQKLMQEGKYGCCTKRACDYCALHETSCDCYEDVKEGKHVCIECYSGWQRGEGGVEGIKKEQVKTDFVEHKH